MTSASSPRGCGGQAGGCENSETPNAKFARIADEIKKNADWRALLAGNYDHELQALDEIAKGYGGESWNTGGGFCVAVIPLGPHDAMGVTSECICHYHSATATNTEEVFYEPDMGSIEGMVSLVD